MRLNYVESNSQSRHAKYFFTAETQGMKRIEFHSAFLHLAVDNLCLWISTSGEFLMQQDIQLVFYFDRQNGVDAGTMIPGQFTIAAVFV
jgi:hypothetical protein